MEKLKQLIKKVNFKSRTTVVISVLVLTTVGVLIYAFWGSGGDNPAPEETVAGDPGELANQGDYVNAARGYMQLAEQDEEFSAPLYEESGYHYWQAGEYEQALESYRQALTKYEEQDDAEAIARISTAIISLETHVNASRGEFDLGEE